MADENNQQQNDKVVDPFEKHIDQAIEAQDGKADVTQTANTDGDKTNEGEGADKSQQQPKDREGGTGDDSAQPQSKDKAGEEVKKSSTGPQDLKLNDGTIVKAGPERRFYEGRELARQQLSVERSAHNKTRQQLEQLQERFQSVENSVKSVHGVEPQQLALGVRLVSDLQRDPKGTIKKLLTEAAAQGINIEDIGVGVDTAAIQRMIDERLPQKDEKTQTDAEILEEAKRESDQFFSRHPDAKPHDELLASVLRDHPDLTLEDAYFQVKSAFIDKGFDWNLTLEQNVEALKVSGDPANSGKQDNQQNGGKVPLPQGGHGANSDFKIADKSAEADDDMDMGDIVRAAMKEQGYNV